MDRLFGGGRGSPGFSASASSSSSSSANLLLFPMSDSSGDASASSPAGRVASSFSSFPAFNCLDRRKRAVATVSGVFAMLLLSYLLFFRKSGVVVLTNQSSTSDPSSSFSGPNTQYAVVVDAGSSGSRAYLYSWPEHSGNPRDLLDISPLKDRDDGKPLVKKATPGISSLQDHPEDALDYISPLLEFAEAHIPREKLKEAPLYILATAGMRLVEKAKQEAIMRNLREGINRKFSFLFPDGNLEVISGKQEGIYQWLAINYALGKFHHPHEPDRLISLGDGDDDDDGGVVRKAEGDRLVLRPRTVGALDMGGASMQLAVEITSQMQMEQMTDHDKSQTVEINLGCREHDTEHTYRIFVTTYLGYGANEAMARHQRDILLQQIQDKKEKLQGLSSSEPADDPCQPNGMLSNVTINLGAMSRSSSEEASLAYGGAVTSGDIVLFLRGTGRWAECYRAVSHFVGTREKFSSCDDAGTSSPSPSVTSSSSDGSIIHCPDPGIKVPPIQLDSTEFFAFSEFWYTMEDMLRMGGPYSYREFAKASADFCATPWGTTWRRFSAGEFPRSDRERAETQCFKSAWMAVALHEGLRLDKDFSGVSSAPNAVGGKVVHWTLGALLYRTRFLPLRSIESRSKIHHGTYHSAFASGYLYSQYVVLLCLLLVCFAIAVYLHRLKRYVKPSTLRKVPSLAFLLPSTSSSSSTYGNSESFFPSQSSPNLVALSGLDYGDGGGRGGRRTMFYA